ncbi:MAG TPA: Hpt domain-containing protein, partial [Burkholderiaceae bacterium]|nr:Hpt domain-containing protein [Burkholderiaceae bacterium]
MRLDDLLAVVRDEFAKAADDIDAALATWMGDEPSNAPTHGESLSSTFERLAEVSRLVGLEGQAHAIQLLRDGARQIALAGDDAAMAEGLAWLAMWRDPLAGTFTHPGDAAAAQVLLEHLAAGPLAPSSEAIDALRALLVMAPSLPDDAGAGQTFDAPTPDDVSIAVPDDVDAGLYETFLAEAPEQLASLGDTTRALARGPVDVARVLEAQRVAHTFKGSGNIIGIRGIGRLAHRMEDILELAVVEDGALPAPMARDLDAAAATLDQMVYALRGEEAAPADALERLTALVGWAKAIDDGSWPERAATALPAVPEAQGMLRAASQPQDLGAHDVEAQVRVPASRMDQLVRQAGHSLVQTGRMAERAERLDERLAALNAAQADLAARLRDLQAQIDRQGVSLRERTQHEGGFDSLEMDRYNELHALVRFVVETAADSDDIARGAREDLR